MGRRKERRLAAISAAGRRVKLDLFAEPLGDLGCSSAQDEVGGDSYSRTRAELPDSPSSSGQQLQNPLMLLEQYSDDELDECFSEGHNNSDADPSGAVDDERKIVGVITTENIGTDVVNVPSVQTVEQLEMDNNSAPQNPSEKLGKECITLNDNDKVLRETKSMEEATSPAATASQVVEDMSLIWKKVLHEESKHYYYWNTITGETSWEVPDVLAQTTLVNCLEKAAGDTSSTSLDTERDDAATGKLNGSSVANGKTDKGAETEGFDKVCQGDSLGNERGNTDANENCQLQGDALEVNGTKFSYNRKSEECNTRNDFCKQLVKHCESLLERLNTLKSLNFDLQWQDFISRSTLEVEIRLADIKALASHGLSLLPFLLHNECQLKQLDAALHDAIQHSASTSEYEATVKSQEGVKIDSNEKKTPCPAIDLPALDYATEKSHFDSYNDVVTACGLVPSVGYPTTSINNDTEAQTDIIELEMQSELISKPVYQSGEEVDMDVDMEVEDTSTLVKTSIGDASDTHYHVLSEQSNLHSLHASQENTVPQQLFSVQPPHESWIPPPSLGNESFPPPPPDDEPFPPPPPDDEPFPPPPPDEEPFPPPPPDEPPETSYPPPSHLESVHTFPYSEQYILSYPSSNLEFYGQSNTEVSGTTLYAHPEGVQVAVPHLPHYYDAVPNVYAVAPLVVNPVEPSSYYGLQNGNLNPISLVSGAVVESSGTRIESVLENQDTNLVHSSVSNAEARSSLVPKTYLNLFKSGQGNVKEPEVSDAQPSIRAESTASVTQSVSASTSDATTSIGAATSSKVQSKVSRGKKRTVAVVSTLRSNKKVSSLVDKWKAAKEELHEEEEEPESAYEMLEKKRQREIEEWQAQQIASGEAKDNANFQPLGGDWRERVKRKRALKMKETEEKASEPAEVHKQPDLVELSRGLPSGWQAFWDESSKQVYYGNVVTSKTTWIKPKD